MKHCASQDQGKKVDSSGLSRRQFLGRSLGGVAGLSLMPWAGAKGTGAAAKAVAPTPGGKPRNVVLLVSDDQGFQAGCLVSVQPMLPS